MSMPSTSRWDRRSVVRLTAIALLGTLLTAAVLVAPAILTSYVSRASRRSVAIRLLAGVEVFYVLAVLASLVTVPLLISLLLRARRRRVKRPRLARLLLLSVSILFASGVSEIGAVGWKAWSARAPDLSGPPEVKRSLGSVADRGTSDELLVVVVGESSAFGVPYHGRLSIGEIVGWSLRQNLPGRKIRVEVQARSGLTMARMHNKLATLDRRPDVLIVYAGHNEFATRYPWFHGWPYYLEDRDFRAMVTLDRLASRVSPLCRLIQEAISSQRVDEPPLPWVTRQVVDVPAYTPEEYAERLADFRSRLDAIAEWSTRSGAATVLVIPPANDAGFEPNRSFLSPGTRKADRERFATEFLSARHHEETEPTTSEARYRALLTEQPSFAEAHFRLARLLEKSGRASEAYPHYVMARDLDGLPMRCHTEFQNVFKEVAGRRGASLVDGQTLFRTIGANGLLGDDLFNDAMHPSLRGHIALAEAVVQQLRERPELGWAAEAPIPRIDPIECAKHFRMDAQGWAEVCRLNAEIWRFLAYAGYDPSERLSKANRFEDTIRWIRAGRTVESLKVPGIGISPSGK